MRERKRKVEDAKKIHRIVHEKDKSKASRRVEEEMGDSCITMSRSCSASGKVGIGTTTKAGGLIQSCAPKQDGKKWSTFAATRRTQESPGNCACARLEEHPSRQDGRRLTRDNQESPTYHGAKMITNRFFFSP